MDPHRSRAREQTRRSAGQSPTVTTPLSLAPRFLEELLRVDGVGFMLNYGLNKLRFPAALPVGDRVRMHLRLGAVDDVSGGVMVTSELTFEREGGEKPVCVAEALMLAYAA